MARARIPHPPHLRAALVVATTAAAVAPQAAAAPRVTLTPAAGPAATAATLTGAGFGRGASVTAAVKGARGIRATADRRGAFSAGLTIPEGARGRLKVVSRSRRARVVNAFRVGGSTALSEVASALGPRLRWRVAGGSLRLAGSGFRPRQLVLVRGTGRPLRVRSDGRGRWAATAAVESGSAVASAGRVRLPFRFRPSGGAVGGPQPAFPIRAAFYYPWFPEAWRQRGLEPFTHFTPSAGFYSSEDPAVLRRHVAELRYAKVQAGIVSWFGPGSRSDRRVPALLRAADGTGFKWAIFHEGEGHGDPDPASIRADLVHIRDSFAADPNYLRVNGRFVVFVWTDGNDGPAMAERWRQANDVGAYVALKVFSGFRDAPSQSDAWYQYAPAQADEPVSGQSYSVSAGFWHAQDSEPRLARDAARYRASVRAMVASGAPWQLVTTFNEWGEGTAVEPAAEWDSPSGFGAYLDALHDDGR